MKKVLEKGSMFYGNLSDKHFYKDGYNYDYYDQYGLQDNITETSRDSGMFAPMKSWRQVLTLVI